MHKLGFHLHQNNQDCMNINFHSNIFIDHLCMINKCCLCLYMLYKGLHIIRKLLWHSQNTHLNMGIKVMLSIVLYLSLVGMKYIEYHQNLDQISIKSMGINMESIIELGQHNNKSSSNYKLKYLDYII